jgi:hypothetical protein
LELTDNNNFQISAPQSPAHYTSKGNDDMLDIVLHKNVRLSDATVSDTLESDHLPIFFHIMDHVENRKVLNRAEKLTDWERFQRLASELISPRIQINSDEEAYKSARDFPVCRLYTEAIDKQIHSFGSKERSLRFRLAIKTDPNGKKIEA